MVEKKSFEKIAIVGTAASSMQLANNLDDSWGIYCLNATIKGLKRFDLHIELHDIQYLREYAKVNPEYFELLYAAGNKTMLQREYDEFPEAQIYPLAEIKRAFGDYFNNSASLLLALAMLENPNLKHLKVYGIEMSGDGEYAHQRACFEHYLGIAKGRGVQVSLPTSCPLLYAPYIYGIEPKPTLFAHAEMVHSMYKGSHDQWLTRRGQAEANEDYYRGGKESIERFLRTYKEIPK